MELYSPKVQCSRAFKNNLSVGDLINAKTTQNKFVYLQDQTKHMAKKKTKVMR